MRREVGLETAVLPVCRLKESTELALCTHGICACVGLDGFWLPVFLWAGAGVGAGCQPDFCSFLPL